MPSHVSPQFQEILDAAKEKRGDYSVDTMIVQSHLAQMRLFILRRGIEFFCEQDSYGGRVDFLNKVYEKNMLEMKLESIIDYFLCDGQGLFYFRPSGDSYQLLYFPKDSYRAYRDQYVDISQVELIYSFAVKEPMMAILSVCLTREAERRNISDLKYLKIGLNKKFQTRNLSLKMSLECK